MSEHAPTCSGVAMEKAFTQPRVKITSKTGWSDFTSLDAGMKVLELAEHGCSTIDIKSTLNGKGLSLKTTTLLSQSICKDNLM